MARQQTQSPPRQQGGNAPRESRAPMAANLTYPEIAVEYGIDKAVWLALRNMYPKGADQSLVMVYEYCKVRQLDALKKPVHIVPMWNSDLGAMVDTIMPGIQEMRTTASRTGVYAGQDPVVLGPMVKVPVTNAADVQDPFLIEVPQSATVTVYKLVQGKRYAFTHTEYFLEAVARERNGRINDMWQKRPIGQLSKCAEAGALRKAFPEELGGQYAAEEMEGREEFAGELQGLPAEAEHGASGIPAPETKAVASKAEEADVPAPKQDAKPAGETKPAASESDAAALARLDERNAAKAATAAPQQAQAESGAEPAVAATQDTHEPESVDVGDLTIDLPAGAASVLERQMQSKGIKREQLLAKLGESVTTSNINQALALVKGWNA